MGKGYIVRRGGGGEQTTKPIFNSVVSSTFTSITVNIENDDNAEAALYYSVVNTDPGPDQANTFTVTLAGRTAGNATITGLTQETSYTLYIKGFAVGKFPSDIVTVASQLQTAAPIVATGGTITTYSSGGTDYKVHTFTGNGTFTVTSVPNVTGFNQADYLIIAGGGGGGRSDYAAAGGGAGGYRTTNGTSGANSSAESKVVVTPQGYSITVGSGGAGRSGSNGTGTNGGNSSALGITSTGGGGGGGGNGSSATAGAVGGSGGGGSANGTADNSGSGTANQGFKGGRGNDGLVDRTIGGGGGGASAVGGNASTTVGGNGGNGLANTLRTGSSETRAGGGGGANQAGATTGPGVGGSGGGGRGGDDKNSLLPIAGTVNTGSGGGGGAGTYRSFAGNAGANGGSGIVVIRYVVGGNV